jgi:3-oxochol-4-en-24-oyl-CoA dehydrogenase
MNLELSETSQMMRDTFARFLSENSSAARVRAALPGGFDQALWSGLAELGAFAVRVPEASGGLGLGTLDAAVLMEEVGRTLASGPIVETLVVARLLALLGGPDHRQLLEDVLAGRQVVSLAYHDIEQDPVQWVAGGAVARAVIARDGQDVVLIFIPESARDGEPNLASTPVTELDLKAGVRNLMSERGQGLEAFTQALEEWKLLMAAALFGLAREAARLAAAYARERVAFGQPIGSYQGISHPLADLIVDIDAGKYLTWKVIRDIADQAPHAGAQVALAAWWAADTAGRTVAQALQTFGGYGLTTEYDIHLYNLRAKAWPLTLGDPSLLLQEAGRRLYGGESSVLPDVGKVSIDFDLGEDARAFAKEVDDFFKRNLTPELKARAHYSFAGHDPGLHRKLAQSRLLFPSWPREYGGRGATPYAARAARNLWEVHEWSAHAIGTTGLVGAVILRFGSDEVKREVLSKIMAGDAICSLGYSEPGCGSDVFAAKTRATRDGDGWRIDGQKMFTSGANIADYVLLLTRTDPDASKHQGLTMFIVPLKASGVTIQAVHTFQDERTNATFYDGVRIPDSYRLGEVNGGVKAMAAALEQEHGGGDYTQTLRMMLHAAEKVCRDIRGRGRPLIEEPLAQMRLARVAAHAELSYALSCRALWVGVEKKPNLAYGPMAKLFSTEKFLEDASDLLNLTAPHSLSKRRGPLAFLNQCYRHAHGTRIYGGTSQIHRSLIAERALGMPRSRG